MNDTYGIGRQVTTTTYLTCGSPLHHGRVIKAPVIIGERTWYFVHFSCCDMVWAMPEDFLQPAG